MASSLATVCNGDSGSLGVMLVCRGLGVCESHRTSRSWLGLGPRVVVDGRIRVQS